MTREWGINHIKRNGYKVFNLGKNIKALKDEVTIIGNVTTVHKSIFGYQRADQINEVLNIKN